MRQRLICLTIFIFLFAALLPGTAGAAPSNSAASAILIHADTGEVLFQQNANEQMLIASTTKLMTALVILNHCGADEAVEIKAEHINVEGSSMYLRAGESYTVRELLYGLLLVSGNDAAQALAVHCSGSVEGFAELMNTKAAELGLLNSSFKNPHGLDAEGHYSTAADLAEIMRAAMEQPIFREIVATKNSTVAGRSLMNHNKLLWSYDGMLGGKTGYTRAAGRSLVTCAERDGLRLICVTLSDPDDWDDHKALYDWGFAGFRYVRTLPLGSICSLPVISGERESVGIVCSCDSSILIKRDAKLSLTLELPEFVYAGIKQGDCAGRAFITADGVLVGEFPLYFAQSVSQGDDIRLSPFERIRRTWLSVNKYGYVFGD